MITTILSSIAGCIILYLLFVALTLGCILYCMFEPHDVLNVKVNKRITKPNLKTKRVKRAKK